MTVPREIGEVIGVGTGLNCMHLYNARIFAKFICLFVVLAKDPFLIRVYYRT